MTGIGFVAGEGGGAQGDNLTLRGFNARTDIFLDGIRDVGMYTRDTFNLEAVEVFKGPSALLFGRGSTGGVINQVSKTPKTSRFYIGTLRVDYKYSDAFRLRNETRYGWYGRQALPGVPQPPTVAPNQPLSTVNVTVTRPQRDSEESIVANNLDAVLKWSLGGFKSTLTTGFELSYQTFDITRWTQPQTTTPLLNPDPFRAIPNAQRLLAAKSDSDGFGAGVYAVNDLSITDWLRFLAGVRWDY